MARWFMILFAVLAFLSVSAPVPKAFAEEEPKSPPVLKPTKAGVSSRLDNVKRLLEVSSGADRVKASGNAEAIAKREEAISAAASAEASFKSKDYKESNEFLTQATTLMFEAVRMVGTGDVGKEKSLEDYNRRAASVDILMEALERISTEKKSGMEVETQKEAIEAKVALSKSLLAEEKIDDARRELDEAYEMVKVSIEALRGGDTLIRSLDFATKEEEYHYEIDRNDTHRMLIDVLLEEKRKTESIDNMVSKFVAQSESLRKEAEAQAAKGDYEAAIATLDRSTKELVRAIRSAGVYIPG